MNRDGSIHISVHLQRLLGLSRSLTLVGVSVRSQSLTAEAGGGMSKASSMEQ